MLEEKTKTFDQWWSRIKFVEQKVMLNKKELIIGKTLVF